ncbi:MAG TPA: hypothetical protein PKN75_14570 [Bacteroidia bacterium]|nr:hypothetical protein [Bacteroidia bacterium]
MTTFYEIEIERKKNEALIEALHSYDHLSLRRGEFIPPSIFEMRISEGKNLYDIIGFQDISNFAISEKVYNLLISNNITGWRSFDVSIKGVNEKYFGFQVIGRSGRLILPKTKGFYTGYKFDQNTWDNSDFFSPEGTALLFCTQKVRDILQENGVTNIEINDIDVVKVYSVGD